MAVFYKPNPEKAVHAAALVCRLLGDVPPTRMDWVLYMAERGHINGYGRPVIGLRFRSVSGMPGSFEFGSAEPSAEGIGPLGFDGRRFYAVPGASLSEELFSESDVEALEAACSKALALGREPEPRDMPGGWDDAPPGEWLGSELMVNPDRRLRWMEDMGWLAGDAVF